eukprot:gene26239-biopygen15184
MKSCHEEGGRGRNRAGIEAADPTPECNSGPHGQHDFEDMWAA